MKGTLSPYGHNLAKKLIGITFRSRVRAYKPHPKRNFMFPREAFTSGHEDLR